MIFFFFLEFVILNLNCNQSPLNHIEDNKINRKENLMSFRLLIVGRQITTEYRVTVPFEFPPEDFPFTIHVETVFLVKKLFTTSIIGGEYLFLC